MNIKITTEQKTLAHDTVLIEKLRIATATNTLMARWIKEDGAYIISNDTHHISLYEEGDENGTFIGYALCIYDHASNPLKTIRGQQISRLLDTVMKHAITVRSSFHNLKYNEVVDSLILPARIISKRKSS